MLWRKLAAAAMMVALLGACSTGGVIGGATGAAGGYALDGKRGAVIGGVGGAVVGNMLDR